MYENNKCKKLNENPLYIEESTFETIFFNPIYLNRKRQKNIAM